MTERCECGAADPVRCRERFDRLLALDHSREAPWGPLHGVAVACYRLGHPGALRRGEPAALLGMLDAFLTGGAAGADRFARHRRRAVAHRGGPAPSDDAPVAAPTAFGVSIDDVAAGGDFPADGHTERVRAWAEATAAAWRP